MAIAISILINEPYPLEHINVAKGPHKGTLAISSKKNWQQLDILFYMLIQMNIYNYISILAREKENKY